MSHEEINVFVGFAGFWAGILLGLGLFGFPVRALDLSAPFCAEWQSVDRASVEPSKAVLASSSPGVLLLTRTQPQRERLAAGTLPAAPACT